MKRFLAILGAIAMILVAVLIRGVMDDDKFFDSPNRNGGSDNALRLVCDTELADICRQLERDGLKTVTVKDPGLIIDDLEASQTADFDLWLTAGPWPEILADNLRFGGEVPKQPILGTPGPVLARSPAVVVTLNQTSTSKASAACPDGVALSCATSDPTLKAGIASPRRGDGLVSLAQAVSNRQMALAIADGREFNGFDSNDLNDPELGSWISALASVSNKAKLGKDSPLYRAIQKQGLFQIVGALEADAVELLADRPETKVFYPLPVVTADVRLVPRNGVEISDELDDETVTTIKTALRSEGWRVDGQIPKQPSNAPGLSDDNGLPEPGVLQVLRQTWGNGG